MSEVLVATEKRRVRITFRQTGIEEIPPSSKTVRLSQPKVKIRQIVRRGLNGADADLETSNFDVDLSLFYAIAKL